MERGDIIRLGQDFYRVKSMNVKEIRLRKVSPARALEEIKTRRLQMQEQPPVPEQQEQQSQSLPQPPPAAPVAAATPSSAPGGIITPPQQERLILTPLEAAAEVLDRDPEVW